MKKTFILSVATILIAGLSFSAVAQDKTKEPMAKTEKVQKKETKHAKHAHKDAKTDVKKDEVKK